MATNKNASIPYRVLDKCFRNFRHRYYIEDIIDKCEEKLKFFNFNVNVIPRTDIFYTFHSYYVKQFNNRWFLFGFEDKYESISNLALYRITKLNVVNDIPFKPNITIDFKHHFEDIIGISISKYDVEKEHIVL